MDHMARISRISLTFEVNEATSLRVTSPVRFTPKKTSMGWRINVPAKLSETGKGQQLFHRTQALALEAAGRMKLDREEFGKPPEQNTALMQVVG